MCPWRLFRERARIDLGSTNKFTVQQKLVLLLMLLGFAVLIWGVIKRGWYIDEIATLFLIMGALCAIGMYIVQILISVIIPSGSGMASVTMPIMRPLATLLGMTQQTAVLIYQFADGFTNIIIPTSGYLLAEWPWPRFRTRSGLSCTPPSSGSSWL